MATIESKLEQAYEVRYQEITNSIQRLKNVGQKIGMTNEQIEADLMLAIDDPAFVKRHAEIVAGDK